MAKHMPKLQGRGMHSSLLPVEEKTCWLEPVHIPPSFLVANEVCKKMESICLLLLLILYYLLLKFTKINYIIQWSNEQNMAYFWISNFPI